MPPQETTTATAAAAEQEDSTTPVPGLASLSLNGSGGGGGSGHPRARAESEGSTSGEEEEGSVERHQEEEEEGRGPTPRAGRPVAARYATTTTHRTVPLAQAIPSRALRSAPPSLVDLALAAIADNCASLVDIRGVDEGLAVRLLGLILQRGKLDYRLCRVFIDAGHPALAEAVAGLNLFDGLACQKVDGGGGGGFGFFPGGCR